ncbi:hypothetical protein [Parasphingorhabdus halotolerans]|nr:hypothetical protein [Parasphingorhabdus halotolerans]
MSITASKDAKKASNFADTLIRDYCPNVVVTQKLNEKCRKGPKSQQLIAVIVEKATQHPVLDVAVERPRRYDNKYLEAEALVARFPELTPWQPKREKCWDREPRHTVIFEALAMAEAAMLGPTEQLAAALG